MGAAASTHPRARGDRTTSHTRVDLGATRTRNNSCTEQTRVHAIVISSSSSADRNRHLNVVAVDVQAVSRSASVPQRARVVLVSADSFFSHCYKHYFTTRIDVIMY